ncbi:hypothetical protein TRVL_10268 [Trypanosoma vivax]|nr:hypothetical protein TRVL_10268 [Trypanosoma vivax]
MLSENASVGSPGGPLAWRWLRRRANRRPCTTNTDRHHWHADPCTSLHSVLWNSQKHFDVLARNHSKTSSMHTLCMHFGADIVRASRSLSGNVAAFLHREWCTHHCA